MTTETPTKTFPAPNEASSNSRNLAMLSHLSAFVAFLGVPSLFGPLVVLFGEVVLEDAGGGCPAERSVGSVVIVEVDEPVVRLSTFVL